MSSTDFPEDAVPVGASRGTAAAAEAFSYGDECVLTLTNGRQLRADTYEHQARGALYVRITDRDGTEIAYWDNAEWRDDPIGVMGAIFGAAKGEQ